MKEQRGSKGKHRGSRRNHRGTRIRGEHRGSKREQRESISSRRHLTLVSGRSRAGLDSGAQLFNFFDFLNYL